MFYRKGGYLMKRHILNINLIKALKKDEEAWNQITKAYPDLAIVFPRREDLISAARMSLLVQPLIQAFGDIYHIHGGETLIAKELVCNPIRNGEPLTSVERRLMTALIKQHDRTWLWSLKQLREQIKSDKTEEEIAGTTTKIRLCQLDEMLAFAKILESKETKELSPEPAKS
ncbi:hypothetical protein ACFL0Z_00090 [Patescibacteria group bacterium]